MKILVTGFEPFGGEERNPSIEAVRMLPGYISGAAVVTAEIPTVFGESIARIEELIERERPGIVLCVGQAAGRCGISVERVAINVDDARIPDNRGNQPVDAEVVKGGKPALYSTLPLKAMVERIRGRGIPAHISDSAGTFVCNHLMYGMLNAIERNKMDARGGFIHVPLMHEQVLEKHHSPSLSLADMALALEAALEAAVPVS